MHGKKKKAVSTINILVESLTGTVFEMRVSPYEQVNTLKMKIQQLEGIPTSQQHILWHSEELKGESTLMECKIGDGATLQLVLGMKGGPKSMKSVPSEEMVFKELTEYVEANKDNLMDSVASDAQVHFLVFREGENINVVKFVERADGTMTPLSSANSTIEDLSESLRLQKRNENDQTREKMNLIRNQMAAVSEGHSKPADGANISMGENYSHSKITEGEFSQNGRYTNDALKSSKVQLPPLKSSKSKEASSNHVEWHKSHNISKNQSIDRRIQHYEENIHSKADSTFKKRRHHHSRPNTLFSNASRVTMGSRMNELGQVFRSENERIDNRERLKSNISTVRQNLRSSWADEVVQNSETGNTLIDSLNRLNLNKGSENVKNEDKSLNDHSAFNARQPLPNIGTKDNGVDFKVDTAKSDEDDDIIKTGAAVRAFMFNILNKRFTSNVNDDLSSSSKQEPVDDHTESTFAADNPGTSEKSVKVLKKHPKKRCTVCQRKTGLATSFLCRCGQNFCSTHRYAELHNCSYDYKTEGRRFIQKNNPLVSAPKIPKI